METCLSSQRRTMPIIPFRRNPGLRDRGKSCLSCTFSVTYDYMDFEGPMHGIVRTRACRRLGRQMQLGALSRKKPSWRPVAHQTKAPTCSKIIRSTARVKCLLSGACARRPTCRQFNQQRRTAAKRCDELTFPPPHPSRGSASRCAPIGSSEEAATQESRYRERSR